MVRVTVDDDKVAMNSDEGGVPEGTAGKGKSQLRVETTHECDISACTVRFPVEDFLYQASTVSVSRP